MYRSMDCFVLPTRGEGWGRPIVEAMAMGLPVIGKAHVATLRWSVCYLRCLLTTCWGSAGVRAATAWSGPSEFLTVENSYPLKFTERAIDDVNSPFYGHSMAEPSVEHLTELMERVRDSDLPATVGSPPRPPAWCAGVPRYPLCRWFATLTKPRALARAAERRWCRRTPCLASQSFCGFTSSASRTRGLATAPSITRCGKCRIGARDCRCTSCVWR